MEFNSKGVGYKETREAIMSYVERKRRDPITAMEIGNQEHDGYDDMNNWWGGECEEYYENDKEVSPAP